LFSLPSPHHLKAPHPLGVFAPQAGVVGYPDELGIAHQPVDAGPRFYWVALEFNDPVEVFFSVAVRMNCKMICFRKSAVDQLMLPFEVLPYQFGKAGLPGRRVIVK